MKKIFFLTLSFSLLFLSGCGYQTNEAPVSPAPIEVPIVSSTPAETIPLEVIAPDEKILGTCQENGGQWLNEYRECENISFKWCEKHGGDFNECASACRYGAPDMVCTLQCIPVCNLASNQSAAPTIVNITTGSTTTEACGSCRVYPSPAVDWCAGGKIITPQPDACGCVGHLICE